MRAIKTFRNKLRLRRGTSEERQAVRPVSRLESQKNLKRLGKLSKPYNYQPLETPDTIRVIQIRLDKESEGGWIFYCDIEHIRIGQVPYDALSYEWGPSTEDDPSIVLNGRICRVRRNLFEALLTLRRTNLLGSRAVPVWIDALSINQSDTLERNHQVELMGMIYRRAAAVMVWPGLTEHYDQPAVHAINDLLHEHSIYNSVWTDNISPAILELCQKPYWNRVWVQQEVFLGHKIFIMSTWGSSVSFSDFDHILGLITQDASLCDKDTSSLIQRSAANALITRKRLPMDSSRLITWLRLACHRGLETSEPRDLVYAMLSISCDCQDGGIEPDYDKPLIDVYLETIYFCGLHKPGQENVRFRKTLAEKLGLSWDSDMETKIKEYHERNITVQREA